MKPGRSRGFQTKIEAPWEAEGGVGPAKISAAAGRGRLVDVTLVRDRRSEPAVGLPYAEDHLHHIESALHDELVEKRCFLRAEVRRERGRS